MAVCLSLNAAAEHDRFALVVGTNRGSSDERPLKYAEHDALRVKSALIDVGGFPEANVTEVLDANADDLRAALRRLKSSIGTGPHERLIMYVSSHGADGSLHLAGTELALQELVEFVKAAPVRVGLLVIDACQSGRMTRMKGLRPVDPPAMKIEASEVEGRVLIAASGADEYAQESEPLAGSYFTHYFVAGLRGAADSSRDGQVTLDEAYSWAWARTIEATFGSRGGVQRPTFSVDLRGAGQLIMAEPLKSASRLEVEVQAKGRWLVVAEATGQVFADIDKGEGPLSLALPQGEYRLQHRTAQGVLKYRVTVPQQGVVTVANAELDRWGRLEARKGAEAPRLGLSASGGISTGLVTGLSVQPGAELRLRRDGLHLGPLNEILLTGAWRGGQFATSGYVQTELELRLGLGHGFNWGRFTVGLALEAGPLLILQSALIGARTSLALAACVSAEGRVRVAGPVELFLLGTGGGAVIKTLAGPTVTPRLSASLGVAVDF